MGLKEVFQGVADTIFVAFGNIQRTDIIYTVTNDDYIPGSGVTEDDTSYTISGYLLEYTTEEVDDVAVLKTDRRLLMKVQAYPLITPKIGDEITIDGEIWRVKNRYKDPADAIWDIQMRLPS
ncbi:MAG: hypothetical protein ACYSOO_05085 [Planctomycetota bacterium]|jgi:hypothetical protein